MSSLRAIPDEFDASRMEEGLINRNPVTAFRPIRTTNAKKDVFSLAQIQRLLETAEGDWNGLILCATSLVAGLTDLAKLTCCLGYSDLYKTIGAYYKAEEKAVNITRKYFVSIFSRQRAGFTGEVRLY